MSKHVGIVFAGGSGSRMGSVSVPKQFLILNGKPIIIHTLDYFQKNAKIDAIYVCSIAEGIPYLKTQLEKFHIDKVKGVIPGGTSGQDSIYKTLKRAQEDYPDDTVVLIHDGVRPFITQEVINRNIASAEEYGTAVTVTNCYETIITSPDGVGVESVPFRKNTFTAQAPQSFRLGEIVAAHDIMRAKNPTYENIVDSCTLYHNLGKEVHLVEGNKGNIKVTYPEDFYLVKALFDFREAQETFGLGGNDEYFASK